VRRGTVTRKRLLRQRSRYSPDNPFAMVPVEVMKSPAFTTLPHVARSVLFALAGQYTGRNNGSLTLTRATAAEFGIRGHRVLRESLSELAARGLIELTRPGSYVPPRAAMFAVEWRCIDEPLKDDPHDAGVMLIERDAWRRWTTSSRKLHWSVKRYLRWKFSVPHVDPSLGPTSTLREHQMGPTSTPKNAVFRAPRRPTSHIWGAEGSAASPGTPMLPGLARLAPRLSPELLSTFVMAHSIADLLDAGSLRNVHGMLALA